jgi:ubiquinone/menaquinone biosynthesis C-methylase UbiE
MNAWLHEAGGLGAALAAADRTGLLLLLGEGEVTAEEAAARLGLDARATGLVLEILVSRGIAVTREGRYQAGDALRLALGDELAAPGRTTGLWMQAESFLRTGRTAGMSRSTGERSETYAKFVQHLGRRFAAAAGRLADAMVPGLADHADPAILDVGAGSGVWSLALLERLPRGRVTALDLPHVLERFHERAAALGVADRVDTIGESYHEVALPPARFDVAILANVLHLEKAEAAKALVVRTAAAVKSGGTVVVVDVIDDGSDESRRLSSAYALHLALRVEGSRVHPRAELEAWLASAGRTRVRRVGLVPEMPALAALIAE